MAQKSLAEMMKNKTGVNSGVKQVAEQILVETIEVKDVFELLIPIKENDLETISLDMRENGFDILHPVCIWKEENVLIDGHTRRKAAIKAGLKHIYCYKKSFPDEAAAIEYAIHSQLKRRNLDDAGKLLLVEKLDSLKKTGRPTSGNSEEKGKSAEALAQTLGVSTRQVEKTRSVAKNADEETLEAVRSGKLSLNKAYNKVQEGKKQAAPVEEPSDEREEENPFDIGEDIGTDTDFDSFDEFETETVVEKSVSNDVSYSQKKSYYQDVISMDLHSLAVYLHSVQSFKLSVEEWEATLKEKM